MKQDALEYIKQNFAYDPATGCISKSTGNGCVYQDKGYLRLAFELNGTQRKPMAHRAAWFLACGEWPPQGIDHADGNKLNNKLSNLRLATPQENNRNTACQRNSKLQVKGVRITPYGKYQARITVDKREVYLGTFDFLEEARHAYVDAAKVIHGQFIHHTLVEPESHRVNPVSRFHG